MAQRVEITVYDEPEIVLAPDSDEAGERAIWRLLDRLYPKPLPLRSQPTWELEAQIEHWSRLSVECEGAGAFFVMCREAIRELDAELERRRKLAYRQAESPWDWQKLLDAIKARADLLAVIGSRRLDSIAGKAIRTTGHRVAIRCPFHAERTPSCVIYLDDQHYHCFGCGAGGDAIDAVQALDGLTFAQAVEALANEFGIELPKPQSRGLADVVMEIPD